VPKPALLRFYGIHQKHPHFINCNIRPPKGEGKALLRKKFAIIGGDMRNVYLADLLKKDYQYVEIYGFEKSGKPWALKSSPLDFVLEGSRVVVGGIPLLGDNGFLNMPLAKEKLCFSELLEKIPEGAHLIAGRLTQQVKEQLEQKKVKYTDLLDREEMAVLNAAATAEGAVGILLQEMPLPFWAAEYSLWVMAGLARTWQGCSMVLVQKSGPQPGNMPISPGLKPMDTSPCPYTIWRALCRIWTPSSIQYRPSS